MTHDLTEGEVRPEYADLPVHRLHGIPLHARPDPVPEPRHRERVRPVANRQPEWTARRIREIIEPLSAPESPYPEKEIVKRAEAFVRLLDMARRLTDAPAGEARHEALNALVRVARPGYELRWAYEEMLTRELMAALRPSEFVVLSAVKDLTLGWIDSDRHCYASRVIRETEFERGVRGDGRLKTYAGDLPVFSGTGMSRKTIREHVGPLERGGYLAVERWETGTRHKRRAYRLGIDWPAVVCACAIPTPTRDDGVGKVERARMIRHALRHGMEPEAYLRWMEVIYDREEK
jgi:DNA-binding transcriptional ArsR family regulator